MTGKERLRAEIKLAEGRITSHDLTRATGIGQNNQARLLADDIDAGMIEVTLIRRADRGRACRCYRWLGDPPDQAAQKGHQTKNQAQLPGQRTCLRCGHPFASLYAGNRICPRCAGNNARLGSYSCFEHTHHTLYASGENA